jgi:translation initiation factor IF-1
MNQINDNIQVKKNKSDVVVKIGTIKLAYPNARFVVELDNGFQTVCSLGGKINKGTRLRFLIGDKVKVEISKYDPQKGRIVQKLNQDLSEIVYVKKQSFKKGSSRRRRQ